MKVSPADIVIGNRVRQSLDDGLNELVQSIRDLGQLQPVLVDSDWNLVAGARRVRACELLGRDVAIYIVTNLDDAARQLKAERDENECRKPFTPSEAVEMTRRLEATLKPAAAQRMKAGHNQHTEGSAKFAEGSIGEVREVAAAATDYSRETIRKATIVKDAAEAPDAAPEVIAAKVEMDRTGKVDPAFRTVRALEDSAAESEMPLDASGSSAPDQRGDKLQKLHNLRKQLPDSDTIRFEDRVDQHDYVYRPVEPLGIEPDEAKRLHVAVNEITVICNMAPIDRDEAALQHAVSMLSNAAEAAISKLSAVNRTECSVAG